MCVVSVCVVSVCVCCECVCVLCVCVLMCAYVCVQGIVSTDRKDIVL